MILPGFPTLVNTPGGGFTPGPSVTLTSASFYDGAIYGYIRPGGYISGELGGMSGGSLSASIWPGFITDSVYENSEGVSILLNGDATASLSGVSSLRVGASYHAVLGMGYFSGGDVTSLTIDHSTLSISPGTYTIQLV